MDHIEVREGYKIWHGASHMDDGVIGDRNSSWFDGMSMRTMPDAIRACPKASFTVVSQDKVVPSEYNTHFISVIAFGRVRIVDDPEEKMALLSQTGIDQVVVLRFDEAMAALSAHDFMFDILCKQLGVKVLLAGYDNHFGHRGSDSQEGFADYVKYGEEMGISVVQGAPFVADDVRVSSSKVRGFLHEGNVEQAAQCLGHPYELTGKVVSGEHIGTSMGYPTANLQPTDANKLIPAPGVYAVKVRMEESLEVRHGMMNIGCRPTFNGDHQTLETHIFHFSHDIYGKEMTVWFISRLREETRFSSQEALKVQLEADAHQAETILRKTDEI